MYEIKGDHIIPLPGQKVLKLDGTLRTDSPALAASGASGHIMFERSPAVLISNTQCRSRTILHAGQTPVAFSVYAKVRHTTLHRDLKINICVHLCPKLLNGACNFPVSVVVNNELMHPTYHFILNQSL
jgi:hypothetical protein